jgi:hypothetical protein
VADETEQVISLTIDWPEEMALEPASFVNVFALQLLPDGIVLNFGQASIPFRQEGVDPGTALANLSSVPAIPIGRFILPFERLKQLHQGLGDAIKSLPFEQSGTT